MPMNSKRRSFLRRTAATGAVVATGTSLSGCLRIFGGGSSDAITVGVLSMLETDTGKATERGVEIAAEFIDDEDSIDQEIEVASANTEGTSTGAVEAYNNLINREEADVTLGAFAESAAAGIMPNIADEQKIHLNVGAASPALSAELRENFEEYKYWFRFAPPNSEFFGVDFVQFAQNFMVDEMGWESVAFYREDAAWTNEVTPFLKEEFPNMGLEVKDDVVFPMDTSNYSPYVSNLEDADIDAVFGLIAEAGRSPVQGYAKSDSEVPLVGDVVAVQSPSYLDDMDGTGQNVIGRTHSTWSAELRTQVSEDFLNMWSENYSDRPTKPTWAGLGAFAATNVLANAVERADATDPDDVIPEVENADFDLIQNYQVFGEDEEDPITGNTFPHDLKYGEGNYQSTWSQWRDGEQVTIWPPSLATAEFEQV